jgi:hypothetical protein
LTEFDPKDSSIGEEPNVFKMMGSETEILFTDIQSAYIRASKNHNPEELESLAIFVFGSPNRSELVKCGDIDAFIVSDENSGLFRESFYKELSLLDYDKLDIPPWKSFEPILQLASTGSPEADYADARFIVGDPRVAERYEELGFTEYFTSLEHVLPKIVFHYFFWKHKYSTSSDHRGINLKYSEGATRDNLFFDWYHDLLLGNRSRESIAEFIPQIYSALSYFEDLQLLDTPDDYSIKEAVNLVNIVKSYGLVSVKDSPEKGEAYMKLSFSEQLFYEFPEVFGIYKNPRNLLREYNSSRKKIREYKGFVFNNIEKMLNNADQSDPLINYCKTIIDIWRGENRYDIESIETHLDMIRSNGLNPWYYLASILCQPETESKIIDHIARNYLNKPENEYFTRLIIKHPKSNRETLLLVNKLPRLALAPQTEIKYRNIISKRLTNEQKV